ncbi:MAG: DUF6428 family protein [Planctomycetota bacterium]
MNFLQLKEALNNASESCGLAIELPSGEQLPAHFHITEVGRIDKHFVDCGGVERRAQSCTLQTLVAEDVDHRLAANKLAMILAQADRLGIDDAAEVDIEIQLESIATFRLASVDATPQVCQLRLSAKKTECLAPEVCKVPTLPTMGNDCSGQGCC